MSNKYKIVIFVVVLGVLIGAIYKDMLMDWYLAVTNTNREEKALEALFTERPVESGNLQNQIPKIFGNAYTAAVATSTIRIANCIATPPVIEIKSGENITFINMDTENQVIDFTSTSEIDIQPNETYVINSETLLGGQVAKNGMDLLNFICDGVKKPVGYILVKP